MRWIPPAALALVLLAGGCGGGSGSAPPEDGVGIPPRTPLGPVRANVLAAPWPGFGRDARHSGTSPVLGPQRACVRWRRKLEGPVVPGPVAGPGGVVYAASNGGVLHAIDLRTGRDRWRFSGGDPYGSDLSTSPAVLPSGLVLWPGPDSTLYALDARGRRRWKRRYSGSALSPAVVDGGRTVIVGDDVGTLESLAVTGTRAPRVRWSVRLKETSYGSPAVSASGTVYTTAGSSLYAVRGGRVLWRFPARQISEVSPTVAGDGTVVFGANDDTVYGVSPAGKLRWRYGLGAYTYSSPVVTPDGLAYVGDHKGFMNALDARTGRLVTRVLGLGRTASRRDVGIWTSAAIDSRHDVYFGTRPGHVYGFAPGGRRLLDIDTGATVDSYPALAGDGTLLIGSENGSLYAIAPRGPCRAR